MNHRSEKILLLMKYPWPLADQNLACAKRKMKGVKRLGSRFSGRKTHLWPDSFF